MSASVRILGDYIPLFRFPVLHEAVSTGDPEMVHTVLQHRDYHHTSTALEAVPELLQKILEVVRHSTALPSFELHADTTDGDTVCDILVCFPEGFYESCIRCMEY